MTTGVQTDLQIVMMAYHNEISLKRMAEHAKFILFVCLFLFLFFVFLFLFCFPIFISLYLGLMGWEKKNIQTWSTRPQSQPTQYHVHTTMLCKDDIINVGLP